MRAFLAILFLSLAGCAGSPVEPEPPRNVILILADDLGWAGTSVQLDPENPNSRSDFYETPNLERLAAEGLRFSNAYAPHPNCSPTRLAIQTGKSPAQLRMSDIIGRGSGPYYEGLPLIPPQHIDDIPSKETTIAELSKAADPERVTAHFGKWHLGGGGPGEHGYDEHSGDTTNREGGSEPPDPKRTVSVTDSAVDFLEKRAGDGRRFYMQVSYYAVHLAIRAQPETVARYEAAEPGARHKHPGHAAMTTDLDTGVGRILDALDRLGLAEDVYVVFTSDNGSYTHAGAEWVTTNEPLRGQKASTWEGGIRVPMIVRGPGVPAGAHSATAVGGIDLYPTIRELLEVEAPLPAGVEGGSLAGLIRGRSDLVERAQPLVWHFPHYQTDKGNRPSTAIREGEWKLVRHYEQMRDELYRLNEDLGESEDRAEREPEVAEELAQRMDAYLAAIDAPMAKPNPDYVGE